MLHTGSKLVDKPVQLVLVIVGICHTQVQLADWKQAWGVEELLASNWPKTKLVAVSIAAMLLGGR